MPRSKEGQVRKWFFIQLSLVCQLILLVFTLLQADALDLPIQVIWEDRRPSAYRVIGFAPLLRTKNGTHLLISAFAFFFFGMLFTRMSQTGVCQYYVYLSIRELQNCSDMQLPSPGQLTLFFKEHLSNPLFACSWDSTTHQIVRALPSNKPPFQNTHFTSYHPLWVNRGFIKGEAMRFPSNNLFEISVKNHKNAWRTSNNASKQAGILHNI